MSSQERQAEVRKADRAALTEKQRYLTGLNRMFPGERTRRARYRNPEFLELRRQIMEGNYEAFIERANQIIAPESQPIGTIQFSEASTEQQS